ncbi:MAG: capsular biosynthesis protein [Clostridium sp.]|nr:capsular biosynthesis protein [Clostridium sp.]
MEEGEIKLNEIIHALKKRNKLIAIITLVITVAAIIVAFFIVEPKYEVNTTLFVGKEENLHDKVTKEYSSNDIQMYQKTLDTFATIIKTKTFIGDSLEDSNIDMESSKVINNLTVNARTNTQILEVNYKDTDPVKASMILKAIASRFEKYATELIPNANVRIVENVTVPDKPVSPNKKLYISIAIIIGILIGSITAICMEFLDSTFEDKKELEDTIGLVVLGDIPNLESN